MAAPTPDSSGAAAPPSTQRSFVERLIGALMLDASVYEEVEHDPSALGQAVGVVALAALATAIGSPVVHGIGGFFSTLISSLIAWLVGTGVIWLIGVVAMKCTSDYPELLRTLGFTQAPFLIMVVGIVRFIAPLVGLVAGVWALIAYVIGVRQALDVSTGRAVVVCLIAFVVYYLIAFLGAALA